MHLFISSLPFEVKAEVHFTHCVIDKIGIPEIVEYYGLHNVCLIRRRSGFLKKSSFPKRNQGRISCRPYPMPFWSCVIDPAVDCKIILATAWYLLPIRLKGDTAIADDRRGVANGKREGDEVCLRSLRGATIQLEV